MVQFEVDRDYVVSFVASQRKQSAAPYDGRDRLRPSSLIGLGALASLGFGLMGCSDCNEVGCPAKLVVMLPDFSASEGADFALTACNEGVCVELAWNPACTNQDSARFYASWCKLDATRTQLAIAPHFQIADGDEYQLSIEKVSGEVLFAESFAATYKDVTPSGACESCTAALVDYSD